MGKVEGFLSFCLRAAERENVGLLEGKMQGCLLFLLRGNVKGFLRLF